MNSFIADTHALAWYLTNDVQLGKKAKEIFESAEKGETIILIPTIVLAELLYIIEKKRARVDFISVLNIIRQGKNYVTIPLTLGIIEETCRVQSIPELHDRIIASTARLLKSKVLTKDPHIKNAVETIW